MRYLLALPLIALAVPLAAQDHDHSAMAHGAPETPASEAEPERQPAPGNHSNIDHAAMGHELTPAINTQPPARAFAGPRHAADAIWGAEAMQPSREQLAAENGAFRTASLLVERLEVRVGEHDSYLWDVQGFIGGDLDRFVIKSEGGGAFGGSVEDAEVQGLWSHAISPFIDLQMGARLDVEPETRGHAVLGVQGLAPYMIHLDAAAFLSDRGDVTARIEAEYDQKITQRLILQPRVEVELAAQDIAERDIGAGLTSFAAGLRLRYEIVREFAPYVGIEWEQRVGQTADIARAKGDDPSFSAIVIGVRTWF